MVTGSLCDGSLDHVTWNAITEEGVHRNNFLFPVENWLNLSRSKKFILGLRVQMSQLIWDWIQRGLTKKAINTLKCNHKILNGFLLRQNDINFWRNEGWQYWGLEWQIGILLWVWGWYYRMEGRVMGWWEHSSRDATASGAPRAAAMSFLPKVKCADKLRLRFISHSTCTLTMT